MRRLMIGWVAAATTAFWPLLACAGSNQEVADQIAASLRSSGQLSDYKVAVKYQDGTVWLQGRVRDQEQMNRALRLVFQHPLASRVVNNLLTGTGESPGQSSEKTTTRPARKTAMQDAPSKAEKASAESPAEGPQQTAPPSARKPTMQVAPSAPEKPSALTSKLAGMNPLRHLGESSGESEKVAASRTQRPQGYSAGQRIMATDPTTGRPIAYPVSMLQPAVPPPPAPKPPAEMATEPIPPGAMPMGAGTPPMPMYSNGMGGAPAPTRYDQPAMPNYAWPSYAAYPNYAALTYPKQYSPTAWPYIGPFYPYPQVPLGWRKVTLEWDDGWWFLDFKDKPCCAWWR